MQNIYAEFISDSAFSIKKKNKRCPVRAGVSIISQPDNQKTLFDSSSSTVDLSSDSKALIAYPNFNFADKTVMKNNISFLGR